MDIKLYSVGLKVVDYAKMLAFYRDVIGLEVARAFEDRDDHKAAFFATGSTPFYILWDRPREGDRPPADRIRVRLDLHVQDVDAAWTRLRALVPDAKGPPHPTRWGSVGFSLKDPEGSTIHVLQERTRTTEQMDEGRGGF